MTTRPDGHNKWIHFMCDHFPNLDETIHQNIHKIAMENYLTQQVNYDAKRSKKEYGVDDTVGVCIHEVDHINTEARVLPCKVLSIKVDAPQNCTGYSLVQVFLRIT